MRLNKFPVIAGSLTLISLAALGTIVNRFRNWQIDFGDDGLEQHYREDFV